MVTSTSILTRVYQILSGTVNNILTNQTDRTTSETSSRIAENITMTEDSLECLLDELLEVVEIFILRLRVFSAFIDRSY